MLLLNFSHPLTPRQMRELFEMLGHAEVEVVDLPIQVDNNRPLVEQVVALADRVPLSKVAWHSEPILINPPGYAPVAAALLAEIHGRSGHFPAMLRMRPVPGSTPVEYEAVEIVNLDELRRDARERR